MGKIRNYSTRRVLDARMSNQDRGVPNLRDRWQLECIPRSKAEGGSRSDSRQEARKKTDAWEKIDMIDGRTIKEPCHASPIFRLFTFRIAEAKEVYRSE